MATATLKQSATTADLPGDLAINDECLVMAAMGREASREDRLDL
jgi:hypothetical protein